MTSRCPQYLTIIFSLQITRYLISEQNIDKIHKI